VKKFIARRWFLVALALVLLVGFGFSTQLEELGKLKSFRNGIVFTVLFVMSLPLEFGAMWQSMRRPQAALLAIAFNSALVPLFGWGLSFFVPNEDLSIGLLIAATTPCTLASASVWTRRAGGNDSVAILVTIITNLLSFLIMPSWLWLMVGEGVSTKSMPVFSEMVLKLGGLVVLPICLAQFLRMMPRVGAVATRAKVSLGVVALIGVLSMVMMGAINAGLKLRDPGVVPPTVVDVVIIVSYVMGLHLSVLWLGMRTASAFNMQRGDQIAVGIAGSQKTLMVGLMIAIDCGGLAILPILIYHVGQLLADTVVADRIRYADGTNEVE